MADAEADLYQVQSITLGTAQPGMRRKEDNMTYNQLIERDELVHKMQAATERKSEPFQNKFPVTEGFIRVRGEDAALAVCKRDGVPVVALSSGGGHDRQTGTYATAVFYPRGVVNRQYREFVPYWGYHYQVSSERWDE